MIAADEALLLDRMAIGNSSADAGGWPGARRTRVRGAGIEFHEYRPYQPGDDPRSIDWTAEARLRQLVVRVSQAEGSARVHVLVDVSASMTIGTPSKLACARKLAAAICYVAIGRRDAAGVCTFDASIRQHQLPAAGWPQLARVLALLEAATPAGGSSIAASLQAFGAAVRGPGLVVVLSDFLEPDQGAAGFAYLQHQGLSPAVVQVLAAEELEPELDGDTELVDIERPGASRLVVDASAILDYRRRLDEQCAALRGRCLSQRIPWAQVSTGLSFRQQIARLQGAGLVAVHG